MITGTKLFWFTLLLMLAYGIARCIQYARTPLEALTR